MLKILFVILLLTTSCSTAYKHNKFCKKTAKFESILEDKEIDKEITNLDLIDNE